MPSSSTLFPLLVAIAYVLPFTAGCAEERLPIVRVQANTLAKSFFVRDLADPGDDPEFYMRTSVVDAAAGAGSDGLFTSSDAQPTVRVRGTSRKALLARLTYELVEGTGRQGRAPRARGQVVAAYVIEKHFDIRRDYNQTTARRPTSSSRTKTTALDERQYFPSTGRGT